MLSASIFICCAIKKFTGYDFKDGLSDDRCRFFYVIDKNIII